MPLEAKRRLQGLCEKKHLVHLEDGPKDSYQESITACCDEETAGLKAKLDEVRSLSSEIRGDPTVSPSEARERRRKPLHQSPSALGLAGIGARLALLWWHETTVKHGGRA